MAAKPANWRVTIAEAAKLMNVSVRSVERGRQLMRTGRQDLVDRCKRGEMSVHAALIEAGVKVHPASRLSHCPHCGGDLSKRPDLKGEERD